MSARERSSSEQSVTSGNESLDLYESFARYYDLWFESMAEDIDFYLSLARGTGGPILECMCGTGRILVPLARQGFQVTGVDRSPAMLDRCTVKVDLLDEETQSRIDVIQGDVRDFDAGMKFRLVVVPFNSFLHLLTTEDQERTLRNMRDHMEDNALLVMSVFNPDLRRPEGVVTHKGTRVNDEGEIITKFESQVFDPPGQRTEVHYFYDVSRQDKPVRRVTAAFTLRYLFHREAIDLMERCGLKVEEVYGDYSLSPFKRNSDLMVFLARRC